MADSCLALAANPAKRATWRKMANCVVCTEHANEAVIVEGTAEIADLAARQKFLPIYERKYKFDMRGMEQDILSMKEPVFAVRPRLAFGLWEKHFVANPRAGSSISVARARRF